MARKLEVTIVGDSRSLQRAFGQSASAATGFGRSMSRMGKVVGLAALGASVAVTGGLVVALKRGFEELSDSAKVSAQTAAAIKSTGASAKVTAGQVEELASALSRKTGIDDEAIQAGENLLLTFKAVRNEVGKGNDIFNRATTAALDLSVAGFGSLSATSKQLGKALQDPVKGMTALSRAGVTFSEDQKTAIRAMVETGNVLGAQKLILKEVESQVGGSAKAYGETLPGQLSKLRNAFDELAAKVAGKLVPALSQAVDWVNAHWPEITAVVERGMTQVGSVIGSVVGAIRTHWQTITTLGKGAFTGLVATIRTVANFLRSDLGQAMAAGVVGAFAFAKGMAMITTAVSAAKVAILAFSANPIVLGIGLIAGVAASKLIPALLSSSGQFQSFEGAARAAKGAIDALKASMGNLGQAHLNVESAQLRLQEATARVTEAQNLYGQSVDANGRKAPQSVAAFRDVQRAILDKRQALLDLTKAHADEGTAEQKRTQELAAPINAVKRFQQSYEGLATSLKNANKPGQDFNERMASSLALMTKSDKVDTYAHAMGRFTRENLAAALALAKVDPAAAKAAQRAGEFSQAALDLTLRLQRIPTKKEIDFVVKHGLPAFLKDLGRLTPEASAAGKNATSALARGIAPMSDRAGAEASSAVGAVRGQAGAASGAGFSVGQSAVSGIVAGLRSMWGAVQSAAASIISVVAGALRAKARIGSPSALTRDEIGIPLAQGLIQGFTSYLVANGSKIADATKQAVKFAAAVMPDVTAAGQVIGFGKARAIAMGILQGSPGIVAQVRAALTEAKKAAREAALALVRETKDVLSSGFSDLASAAFAAFDAKASQFKSKARSALEAMQLKDTKKGLAGAITRSAEELEKAKAAAGVSGLSPEDQDAANKAVLAAQQALDDAKKAQWMFQKEQQAQREEAAHVKKMERDRQRFANELAQAQTWINKHPKLVEEGQKRIREVLTKFLGDFRLSGSAVGYAIAQGLEDSLDAVGKAARKVAAEIAKYLKLKSPAERGPLSDLHKWASGFATTYLKSLDTSAISKAIGNVGGMPAMAGAGAGSARVGMGGPMADGGSQIIRLETRINLDGKEIAYNTRDHLVRGGKRNDGGMLPGA